MAVADAKVFASRNEAFRFTARLNGLLGNPITDGLDDLAAWISKDGGTFALCTTQPTELGATGYCPVDLSAAEMDCFYAVVEVRCSNEGAVYFAKEIPTNGIDQLWTTLDFGDDPGRDDLTYGKMVSQLWRRMANRVTNDGEDLVVLQDDNETPMLTMSLGLSGAVTYKGAADNE